LYQLTRRHVPKYLYFQLPSDFIIKCVVQCTVRLFLDGYLRLNRLVFLSLPYHSFHRVCMYSSRYNVSFIQFFFLRFPSVLFCFRQFALREEKCADLFCTFGLQFVCCPAAYGFRKYLMRTARTTEVWHLFEIVHHFLTKMRTKILKQTLICVFMQCSKCAALPASDVLFQQVCPPDC
jgi:hypothetical protein